MQRIQVSKLHTFHGHKDAVYTLQPLNGHNEFCSGAGDGMVVKWDLTQPDKGKLVARVNRSVYALEYIPQKHWLVVGENFEGIHVIDLKENKELGSLAFASNAIFDIAYAEGKLIIATGSGKVLFVDLASLTVERELGYSTKSARCISVNQKSLEFAVGYSDHLIRIFDLKTLELKHELSGHTNSVFTIAYHPLLPLLISAGRDAHIKAWEMQQNYQTKHSIPAHMYAINHLYFSPNGHHFVTCSMDKSIKVWDAHEFKLLKVIDKVRYAGHGTSVNKLYWSQSEQLASCSDDRTITIWDLKT
jgi:WD40 repeat protein